MKRIPINIIINHIIPYTYNIQPKFLLEDINSLLEQTPHGGVFQ
jgi:hypothetical protein